ncbi:serine carboxypeptidase-like 11 [Gastrolobium bilobum]|uniref:serine carboxypeptidase-like 11 n=1 Tax=Gastrolobium bilobum TaxID=150636 RepID=UPI002AB2B06D|nr:serine carboxypeptidase-like 11 [Gastrolobium bilobum]
MGSMSCNSWCYGGFSLSLALFLCLNSQLATSRSTIEVLPGFEGLLPFELETGYVGLGETEDDLQVFYYFIKSENNPSKDPVMLWLSGGPGCSSFSALAYQIGPLAFKLEEYNGSLPNLVSRQYSWTKVCSIIFVDLPLGTGFSYAKNLTAQRSDWKLVHHTHQFFRKWLIEHSEFLSNKLYIGGDSYSGMSLPAVVQEISNGNEKGLNPWINLQGYVLGNPVTTRREKNHQIPFAHGMALISDELYASLQKNCKGEYVDIDSRNELCSRDLHYFDECLSGINRFNILGVDCQDYSLKYHKALLRRSMTQKLKATFSSHLTVTNLSCDTFGYFLCKLWMNDKSVPRALHTQEGTAGQWERCNGTDYEEDISSSFEFHVNLSSKGYRSLIYSGDHDYTVPFMSTQAWIRALNYSIVHDWRPWHVNGQVAGYTRTYSNQMTLATVKGAGHVTSELKSEECFAMFVRWISNVPL